MSINTVTKLLIEAGQASEAFHDRTVIGLKTSQLQCDEIWSYCYAKQGNVAKMKAENADAGDVWTFTALDRDSKMIVSWFAGNRSNRSAEAFLGDAAGRILRRFKSPRMASRHRVGDLTQIYIDGDRPSPTGLRYQVVKLSDCPDARLHGLIALNA